jgi:hypothetical protein
MHSLLLAHGGDCSYVMMHSLLSPLTSVSTTAISSRQSLPPPPLCCSFRYNLDRQGYQALGNTTMGSSGSGGAVVDTVVLVTPPLVTSNRTAVFVFDGRASGGPSTGFSVEVRTWLGVDAQCVCDCVWLCVWRVGGGRAACFGVDHFTRIASRSGQVKPLAGSDGSATWFRPAIPVVFCWRWLACPPCFSTVCCWCWCRCAWTTLWFGHLCHSLALCYQILPLAIMPWRRERRTWW